MCREDVVMSTQRNPRKPGDRRRGRRRLAAMAAGVAAAAVLAGPVAHAGMGHRVTTGISPTTGAPVRGGGTWIVNKPSGYYIGRIMPGGRFDKQSASASALWHYGRALNRTKLCGYAMPRSIGAELGRRPDTCSEATRARLVHRRGFGGDFNARAHGATDGTKVPARRCTLFYNYFRGNRFARGANAGHLADKGGKTTKGHVFYRFTTLDGHAAVVRDPVRGWGFVPVGCIDRPPPEHLHNDDD
jgi:hypothetical protein